MRWISHAPSGAIESAWREVGTASIRAAEVGPPALVQQARGLWLRGATPAQQRKVSGEIGLNPVWSGDGTRVVFDAQDTIAIASPSQSGTPRTLCAGQHPAWSPDGKWIVFQIARDHSHAPDDARRHTPDTMPHRHDDKTNHRIVDSDLWIIGADGTGRHQLTATPDVVEVDPDWSPDGSTIVCGTEEAGRLLVLKIGRR
jgi:Tol biopolymer transport system component